MHRSWPFWAAVAPLIVAAVACSGGNKKEATPPTVTRIAATPAASAAPATFGTRTATPAVASRGITVVPSGGSSTATAAGGLAGCRTGGQTARPPFSPGTPVARPAIDLATLSVAQQDVPAGFTPIEQGGFSEAQRLMAADLVRGTADPQAELSRLNEIGFLGGREQGWNGPAVQGFVPALFVQHLVFGSDAGAADFVHNPVISAQLCYREEPGPSLGQEAGHLAYQFTQPLTTSGTGQAEGHAAFWRCGRVVINVSGAGAPGQITQAQIDAFAQKVQDAFVKVQPCM